MNIPLNSNSFPQQSESVKLTRRLFLKCAGFLSVFAFTYTTLGWRGAFAKPFSGTGFTRNGLRTPFGISLDSAGSIYVTDPASYQVRVYDGSGAFRYSFGQPGQAKGSLNYPKGIAVDREGRIYKKGRQGS